MARAVVWGGMLIVAFSGMFWGMKVMNADSGQLVGYAVSKADANNECELQIIVSLMSTAMDSPTRLTASGKPDWEHWLDGHFILTDDAGHAVDLRKGGFKSQDIDENKAGTAEFIALAKLEAGKTYTLVFVPTLGQPEKYTKTLTAEATEFRRKNFEPDY